jgi:hypothetical protein
MNSHGHKRPNPPVFMETTAIAAVLTGMERDTLLKTNPAAVDDGLGSLMVVTFKEKHLIYLRKHPKVNPKTYLSNLRTMIKIR